jgi:hypothetical protein
LDANIINLFFYSTIDLIYTLRIKQSMDLKFVLLVFGIVFLLVLLTSKAIKKVRKGRVAPGVVAIKPSPEPFYKTWKSLSYLLLLVAAGNLYMMYTGVVSALETDSVIFWIDAVCSLAAALAAVMIWLKKSKTMVVVYFIFTLIPILIFMSIKFYKLNALIHLFPLVLLYFVLKPVWDNLEN